MDINELGVLKPFQVDEKRQSQNEELASSVASKVSRSSNIEISISRSVNASIGVEGRSVNAVFSRSVFSEVGVSISKQSGFAIEPPDPSQVAGVVVGFVEKRLEMERANGADDERLESLMNQAFAGVEAGFSSAREELDDLGLMTAELDREIGDSYGLVQSGLERVSERFDIDVSAAPSVSGSSVPSSLVGDEKSEGVTDGVSDELSGLPAGLLGSRDSVSLPKFNIDSYSERYAESQSYDLQLTTRDGDKVSISLSSAFAEGVNVNSGGVEYASSFEEIFNISVAGELDDDERIAIESFLSEVEGLADLFFSGQFEEAFGAALELDFDGAEIASFSLDLRQAVYEEVRAYGSDSGLSSVPVRAEQFSPLLDVVNAFERATSLFEDRVSLINDLMRDVLKEMNEGIEEERKVSNERLEEYQSYLSVLASASE